MILIGISNGKRGKCLSFSHFEPLFSNHSKTMMLKTRVDIHVFSDVEKYFFDMLSLGNIIPDWCKFLYGYDFV